MIDEKTLAEWQATIDGATQGTAEDAGFDDTNDLHEFAVPGANPCYPEETPILGGFYRKEDLVFYLKALTAMPLAVAEIRALQYFRTTCENMVAGVFEGGSVKESSDDLFDFVMKSMASAWR